MLKTCFSLLAMSFVLGVYAGKAAAQSNVGKTSCSAHFQARANWLDALGGPSAAHDYMETRAEALWSSIPRDCGMNTGFGNQDCRYDPNSARILSIMTDWADQGLGFAPRPTCMEDRFCLQCLRLYNEISE